MTGDPELLPQGSDSRGWDPSLCSGSWEYRDHNIADKRREGPYFRMQKMNSSLQSFPLERGSLGCFSVLHC